LQSSDSDPYLLGTTDAEQRPDGLWDCRQPRVEFLGLDLVPIFVNNLQRQPTATKVTIVDARIEILKTTGASRVVASVMEKSKCVGNSIIRVVSTSTGSSSSTTTSGDDEDRSSCQLSVDLTLTWQVFLPPFVLLPPGFNTLGSAIVRRTGASRTKKLLEDIKQAHQEWVMKKQQQEQPEAR
jgi:hypothetical protein